MKLRDVTAIAAAVLVCSSGLLAQEERLINVQLRDTRVSSVLSLISSQSGQSVIAAAGVSGNIDLSLSNATLTEALDAVSRAAGASWRRVLVPPGATVTDTTRAMTDAQAAPMSNIVMEERGNSAARALLSGAVARRVWDVADDLGLREVYWVYDPASVPSTPRATSGTTASNPVAAAYEAGTDTEPVAEGGVYGQVAKSLSSLDAVDALNMVEQLRQEIVSTMSSWELEQFYGVPSAPRAQVPAAWGPPRVRVGPAPQFNVISQPSAPWWW